MNPNRTSSPRRRTIQVIAEDAAVAISAVNARTPSDRNAPTAWSIRPSGRSRCFIAGLSRFCSDHTDIGCGRAMLDDASAPRARRRASSTCASHIRRPSAASRCHAAPRGAYYARMDVVDIGRNHIAYPDAPSFSTLASKGESPWVWPSHWEGVQQPRQAPRATELCLALDRSRGSYWLEFEPEQDLGHVLDSSRLVHYVDSPTRLVLAQEGSLRDILNLRCGNVTGKAIPSRLFLPTRGGRDEYDNWYTDAAVTTWADSHRLLGQLAVCSCNEPGCSATYAWLEDGQCRLLVDVSAAGISRVELGPFELRSA
jgi:hypothetical protein